MLMHFASAVSFASNDDKVTILIVEKENFEICFALDMRPNLFLKCSPATATTMTKSMNQIGGQSGIHNGLPRLSCNIEKSEAVSTFHQQSGSTDMQHKSQYHHPIVTVVFLLMRERGNASVELLPRESSRTGDSLPG